MTDDLMTSYWSAIIARDKEILRPFFTPDASIKWHSQMNNLLLMNF